MYAAILTVVCGGLLAFASESLKKKQQENIALEQKENILSTVMVLKDEDDAAGIYDKKVRAFVVDYNGNVVSGKKTTDISVEAEYKKPSKERMLPVYEFRSESDSTQIEFVVLPIHGFGLWDRIWGYVALQSDLNTIQGTVFQHKGETPGLGARIASNEIQDRFKGKHVFEGDQIASVVMMKGEGNDYSSEIHKVDGMSGATLTAKGVNNMLKDYLACYENYIKKTKTSLVP